MIEQRRNPTFGDERNYPFPSRFRPRGETWQPLAVVSHKSGGQRVRGMRVFVHACVTRDAFRVEYRRVSSKYWFWSIPVCLTAAPSYFPCISLLSSTIFTTPLRVTTSLPSLPSPMSTRIQRNNARYYECKYKESLPPLSFSFSSLFWMASRLSNGRRRLEFGEKQSLGSSFHARVYVRLESIRSHGENTSWSRMEVLRIVSSIRRRMKNERERASSLTNIPVSRGRRIHPLVSVRRGRMQFEWTNERTKKWIGDSQSY